MAKQQDGLAAGDDGGGDAADGNNGARNGAIQGQEQDFIAETKDTKNKFLLLDLDTFELRCVKERVMIMVGCSSRPSTIQNEEPKILGIEKSGGGGGLMDRGDVEEMVKVAGRRWEEVVGVVEGEERKTNEGV